MAGVRERACPHAPEGGVRSGPKSSSRRSVGQGSHRGDKRRPRQWGAAGKISHSQRRRVLLPIVEEKLTGAVQGALVASTSVSGLGARRDPSDRSLRVGTELNLSSGCDFGI
jgi:hypothetical protein